MSAQRLSDACSEFGHAVPRAVLTNLENGRRPTISLAELLVIARALEVPPVLLLSPLGQADRVEILPGVLVNPWYALKWFAGEEDAADLPQRTASHGSPRGKDGTWIVRMFRDHEHWATRLDEARAQLREAQQALAGAPRPGNEPDPADPEAIAEHRRMYEKWARVETEVYMAKRSTEDAERSLRRVREDMDAGGLTPPKLWPQLAYLEGKPDEQE